MPVFCVIFHASSYCTSTEVASALIFQKFEKYLSRSSIFSRLITLLQIYSFTGIFMVFNNSAELEMCSEPCSNI